MSDQRAVRWPTVAALAACAIVLGTAVVALLGYIDGGSASVESQVLRMSPLTASTLLLVSFSLMLLLFSGPGALRPQTIAPHDATLRRLAVRITRAAATAAAAMALIKLGDYLMGWGLGVDGLFFAWASAAPALMSPATATALALLGAAIVTASFRRSHVTPLALAFVPILIGWLGISRYIFGGEPLLANAALTLPTALCLFA